MKKTLLASLLLITAVSFNVTAAEKDDFDLKFDTKGCLIIAEEDKEDASKVFSQIDQNGDGCLQKNEVDKWIELNSQDED